MPVITKNLQATIARDLRYRFQNLMDAIEVRDLKSNREGSGKGHWTKPELLCATVGTAMELRIAVEDFKTILAEVKKLN